MLTNVVTDFCFWNCTAEHNFFLSFKKITMKSQQVAVNTKFKANNVLSNIKNLL